jgi:DNA-binding transcriptional regulator YhcF (GntR family)
MNITNKKPNNLLSQSNNFIFNTPLLERKLPDLNRKSQLHSVIINSKGNPDYLAINIYYDTLRSWHTPNKMKRHDGVVVNISKLKTKGIYLSYKELAKTHGCSTETIRRKLVKIENLGLIQRSYQHKETVTTKSYNQLIVYVWKQTPYFYNKHGIEQSEVPVIKPQTNHEYITEKYNIDYHSQTEERKTVANDRGIHKDVDTKELIEFSNKLEKNRSRANFEKNSSSEKILIPKLTAK